MIDDEHIELQAADEAREQYLDQIRTKAGADVAHAKEVAAKVKAEKYHILREGKRVSERIP